MANTIEAITQGVNQTVEFKSSFRKEVIKSTVALSNAKGGKVFVWVRDKGDIVVELMPESLQNWINKVKQNTSPSVISLYDNLTIEELQNNHYILKIRNKFIALMLKECGFVKKYSLGIDRIKRLCEEYRLSQSKFEEIKKGFMVTVYKDGKSVNVGVTDLHEFIKSNQSVNTVVMAEKYKMVTKGTIERWLKQLKDEGKMVFKGASETGGYCAK